MRIIDRLLKFLTYKKANAYSFERNCQVANGYLKKQQKGKGSVGSDILLRIHRNYPELNLVWLITGENEMIRGLKEENPDKNQVQEEKLSYSRDEKVEALTERIVLLEALLADKKKIIELLENKRNRN